MRRQAAKARSGCVHGHLTRGVPLSTGSWRARDAIRSRPCGPPSPVMAAGGAHELLLALWILNTSPSYLGEARQRGQKGSGHSPVSPHRLPVPRGCSPQPRQHPTSCELEKEIGLLLPASQAANRRPGSPRCARRCALLAHRPLHRVQQLEGGAQGARGLGVWALRDGRLCRRAVTGRRAAFKPYGVRRADGMA